MRILKFYLTAFIYSWGVWFLLPKAVVLNPYVLASIGGLGPVVALVLFLITSDSSESRAFLIRLTNFKGIPKVLLISSVIVPFAFSLLSNLFWGLPLSIDKEFAGAGIVYPLFLIVFGPIPEEMAWRGIALDGINEKLGYFKAQLIVAVLWASWHLPLFYIDGTYQSSLGILTIEFWLFFMNIFILSFLTGWLYIKSKHSIIIAIIFHYTVNLSGEMFESTVNTELTKFFLYLFIYLFLEFLSNKNALFKTHFSPHK